MILVLAFILGCAAVLVINTILKLFGRVYFYIKKKQFESWINDRKER